VNYLPWLQFKQLLRKPAEGGSKPDAQSLTVRPLQNLWLQCCSKIWFMWNRKINICSLW